MIGSAEEFVALRTSSDPAEYRRAAGEEAPLEVWRAVIDGHPGMRVWVAQNRTVPLEILERLAADPDGDVRVRVAMKRKLTPELFSLLAGDPLGAVRRAVAFNASAPDDVLRRLAGDPEPSVSDGARRQLAQRG